ncbi:transposase [Jeongeupia naejangsanensis]|uniref:Transposase n=1 Tax=Jeongeupia naejangsanensis TaxID=613195 RepID=A0ABS2BQJ0_9NEIS|nr:transposase [Jeongeupia naejangsanensis]
MLAHVLVNKFGDHQSLYRQPEIYARESVEIPRPTSVGWVGALLHPLVEALRQHVMAGGKPHMDETPVAILMSGNGSSSAGRIWTYVRDDRPAGSQDPPAA